MRCFIGHTLGTRQVHVRYLSDAVLDIDALELESVHKKLLQHLYPRKRGRTERAQTMNQRRLDVTITDVTITTGIDNPLECPCDYLELGFRIWGLGFRV